MLLLWRSMSLHAARISSVGALALAALLAASCDDGASEPPPESGPVFLANATSFAGFTAWRSWPIESPTPTPETSDIRARIYANQLPPADLDPRRFPVGTIFIKTFESDLPMSTWIVHAMVKRGGFYNVEGGAVGWEYFELRLTDAGAPIILWRGTGPESGSGYTVVDDAGVETELTCNQCHAPAWHNDTILNRIPELDLDGLR